MAEDGSVVIDVRLNTAKADKELARMNAKIDKLANSLEAKRARKGFLSEALKEDYAKLDAAQEKVRELKAELSIAKDSGVKSDIKERLADAMEEQKRLMSSTGKMQNEYDRISQQIAEGDENLKRMQEDAGKLSDQIERQRPFDNLASSLETARHKIAKFIKYAIGIRSLYVLFRKLRSAISGAVQAFAAQDKETQTTINSLKASLETLRLSWGAAFAPILNAIAPLLQTLINWLTAAANAVARFIAIISGRSTYKKAVANNNALASSIGGVGAAAQEAKNQLAGFDDLNILQDNKSGGGGGGGASAAQLIEEATDAFDGSFLSSLALTVKDVFFDWSDWNAEKILEKCIAFIPAAAGAYIGWNAFGFKGAVIGGLLGLAFGLIIDSNTFNHDGKIDADEIKKLAINAIPALAGMITGIATANPVLGFAVGLALTLIFEGFKNGGSTITESIERAAIAIFPEIAGLVIGMATGHPLLGLTIGFIISLVFEGFRKNTSDTKESWMKKIKTAMNFPDGDDWKKNFKQWIWDDGIKAFFEDALTMVTGHSFGEASQLGEAITDEIQSGLVTSTDEKLTDWMDNTVEPYFEGDKWAEMGATAGDSLSESLKQSKLPEFIVRWAYSTNENSIMGKIVRSVIASPILSWYARGGVFNSASVIGVGESGKEAVVPLEHNTEWINLVAEGLINRLLQNDFIDRLAKAFMSTPMPAMAGSVVPPNSLSNSDNSDLQAIKDTLSDLRNMLDGRSVESGTNAFKLYIDGREVYTAVKKYERQDQRGGGW